MTPAAPRLFWPLALVALLGAGLLSFAGLRLSHEAAQRARDEAGRAGEGQLDALHAGLSGLFADRVPVLLTLTDDLPGEPEALRERLRRGVWYRHALVVDARGTVVFPPPEARSAAEAEFVERARPAWSRGLSPAPPADAPGQASGAPSAATGGARTRPDRDPPAETASLRSWSWQSWFWGPGVNVGFVRRLGDGRTVLVELERARLLSDVIARLPDGDADGPPARLTDEAGRAVYAWGGRRAADPLLTPALRGLPEPLSHWHLEQSLAPATTASTLGLWAGIGAAIVVLLGALAHVHREGARAYREAQQRVTFVNQVSHELKTPLTNIRLYAEMLEEELALEPEDAAARHLHVVVAESQRLSRLITNILTFARSQRHTLKLSPRPVSPDAVLRGVVEGFTPALAARGITPALRLDAAATRALDPDALEQIVGNLVGNVEKYAATGGRVDVESRLEGDLLVVTVSDAGPGIPPAARERVFLPFERLDDRLTEGASGTGIGLTIARQLARLHGGDVRLVDAPVGARFEVRLRAPA
jgi:signal transduction histidine kinase